MRLNGVRMGWACAATFTAVLATLTRPVFAGAEADFQKLLTDKAPAIVTIKFVLKTKSSWGDNENESEATGVIIEPNGLIMCSKTKLGDYSSYFDRSSSSTPTDIKVLIGDDSEGLDAQLIARDSELDLTWLRIKDPGNRKFPCVNLHESAVPAIGDRLYYVSRMGEYFDRVAVVREGRIGGITTKPRKLYIPSGGSGELGLPVYNARGELIGVPIHQTPDREEMESTHRSYGGWGLILPADEVRKATQRAKQAADQDEEDEE